MKSEENLDGWFVDFALVVIWLDGLCIGVETGTKFLDFHDSDFLFSQSFLDWNRNCINTF